jgi:hypothetical protein
MLKLDQKDDIDYFVEALEEMIDARDDMWQEEKFCNYRQATKIWEDRYVPAREKLRYFLLEIVQLKVEQPPKNTA